jgi:hypothetical protein
MSDNPEKLEQIVDRLVRSQPLRRAPAGLEARVLARIAARESSGAERAWWRTGFAHWPVAARIAFLILACAVVPFVVSGLVSVLTMAHSGEVPLVGPVMFRLRTVAEAASATASLVELVARSVPPSWIYGAATCALGLYALLFGLGTVAYRSLYANR